MHVFFVQLLVMLLVHQASASLPSDTTLPASTGDTMCSLSDLDLMVPICEFCNLSIHLCRCLERVRLDSWQLQQQSQTSSSPYFGNAIPPTSSPSAAATPVPAPGNLERRYSTIRPEDLVQHEQWPGGNNETAPAASEAAALGDGPLPLPEDIQRLNSISALPYPDSIPQWSAHTYNVGDRLAPPVPTSPPRTREPMQIGGFPCNHSSCSEVFDRKCDLRRHKKKHVPASDRPHKCSQCEQAFTYPKDRDRHEMTHKPRAQSVKIFCPVEGCRSARTGFGRRDNYLRHMRQKHSWSSLNTQGS